MNREKLKSVHDQDLEILLERLGVSSKFRSGKLKCSFCKNKIDITNLHSLYPQSGQIKWVCDNPKCIDALHGLLREGKVVT